MDFDNDFQILLNKANTEFMHLCPSLTNHNTQMALGNEPSAKKVQ